MNEPRQTHKLTQYRVSLVLRPLGVFEVGTDSEAQLILSYLTTLYFRYRDTLIDLQPHHELPMRLINRYFEHQRRAFPREVTQEQILPLAKNLKRKLQKAPLVALLTTGNLFGHLSDDDWLKLQLWTAIAAITSLMFHYRYYDINQKRTLMPAVAAALQKLRLAQTANVHFLTLQLLELPCTLAEFSVSWPQYIEQVTREVDVVNGLAHGTTGSERYGALKSFFTKFWQGRPSQSTENTKRRERISAHETYASFGSSSVSRFRLNARSTRKDYIEGEENRVDQRDAADFFSISESASPSLSRQRLLENKQSHAISNSIIKRELALPAHTNTLERCHVLALLGRLKIDQLLSKQNHKRLSAPGKDNNEHAALEADLWIMLTLLSGQLPSVLMSALIDGDPLKIIDIELHCAAGTDFSIQYRITRRPRSHRDAAKIQLVSKATNSLTLRFPSGISKLLALKRTYAGKYAAKYEFIDVDSVQARLDEHCSALNIRRVTLRQLSKFMFMFLMRRLPERAEAAAMSGMQAKEWTPLYYVTLNARKIQQKHANFCAGLLHRSGQFGLASEFNKIANKVQQYDYRESSSYGSILLLKHRHLITFMGSQRAYVRELSTNTNWTYRQVTELFNEYTIYVVFFLKLQTGVRPVDGLLQSVLQLDFANLEIFIQDKERRDGASRYVPMTEPLAQQLKFYLIFIKQVQHFFIRSGELQVAGAIESVLSGEVELFNSFTTRHVRGNETYHFEALSTKFLHRMLEKSFPVPLNFARHTLRTWFTHYGLNSSIVDDFMGHDLEGQMRLGKYSSHRQSEVKPLISALHDYGCYVGLIPFEISLSNTYQVKQNFIDNVYMDTAQRRAELLANDKLHRNAQKNESFSAVRRKINKYIEEHFVELHRGVEHKEADQKLERLTATIKAESSSLEQHHMAILYVSRLVDTYNQHASNKLALPNVPARIKREVPIRDFTWPSMNYLCRTLFDALQTEKSAYAGSFSNCESRAMLVFLSVMLYGIHDKATLSWLMNIKRTSVYRCLIAGKRIYYVEYKEQNTRYVNDNEDDKFYRVRRIYLQPIQLMLVAKIFSDTQRYKPMLLTDVLPTLSKCKALQPVQRQLNALSISQFIKASVDTSRNNVQDWSVALSHVANATIRTFDLPTEHFNYLVATTINLAADAPEVGVIDIVKPSEPSTRASLKKGLGGYAQKFHQRITRALKTKRKAEALSELRSLKAIYGDFDASNLLLEWLISLLDFRKNSVSTARRYHSAFSLSWLVVTHELDDLTRLNADQYYEIYQSVIETAHPGVNTDDDSRIEEEQLLNQKKDKNQPQGMPYTVARVNQFHEFLITEHRAPRLTQSLGSSVNRRERIRAAYIPLALYQATLGNMSRTKGVDFDVKACLRQITVLAYRTGLRASEITTRRMKDLVCQGGEYFLYVAQNQYTLIKTFSGRRKINVSALLSENELRDFSNWLTRRRTFAKVKSDLLFCSLDNPKEVLSTQLIEQSVTAWLRAISGRLSFTFHDLRHTALSNLQVLLEQDDELATFLTGLGVERLNNIRQKVLAQDRVSFDSYYALTTVAGHSSPEVTFHSYLHFSSLLTHRVFEAHHQKFSRFLLSLTGAASHRQIARLCEPIPGAESESVRHKSKYANNESIKDFVDKHYKQLLVEPQRLSQQAPATTIVNTVDYQPSLTEVIKILEAYVIEFRMRQTAGSKEKAAHKVASKFGIPVALLNVYRAKAREILEKKTKFKNLRTVTKNDKTNDQFLPRPPQTPAERKLARKIVQKLVEWVGAGHLSAYLKMSEHVLTNIYSSEPGVRFKKLREIEEFVADMKPFVSKRRWFLHVVCTQPAKLELDESFDKYHPLLGKQTTYKNKLRGTTEFYLRLKSPKSNDQRKKDREFVATSLIKYVFAMTEIIVAGEMFVQSDKDVQQME